jgi:RNA polymerase sigma factor (TIGR02999 family)
MAKDPETHVTELLGRWSEGDESAFDELVPLVYAELRRIANIYMKKENIGHTLQPTSLVNEAFIKLMDQKRIKWQNRGHFYAVAATIMRRILVDHARKRAARKRGGGEIPSNLHEATNLIDQQAAELLALDKALESLKSFDERKCRIVELRYYVGLTNEEIAEILNLTPRSVLRDWTIAKAWLRSEITRSGL